MKLETVTWLVTLVVVTSAQQYFGAGQEYGRIAARLRQQNFNRGARDRASQRRDATRFSGQADQKARWAGQSALRDNSLAQNQADLQRRAQAANQNFGKFSNNFADIAKQIRKEALRNQYVIKDDAQYKRNNLNSAEGSNQAKAKKTEFDKGEALDDNINYIFKKKFDKASSENGGYEEENGRQTKKLDLIDEREKDRKLLRGDSEVSRTQSDNQKSFKNQEQNAKAAQKQAQDGKYGFKDRRLDQAGERSDDRSVDYDRKDSKFLEQESGRDEAVRLAKDLAQQQAGYNNEALATADASRNVDDKKFYGGQEVGGNSALQGQQGYGPDSAAEAGASLNGDKAKHEGSGGAIKSGFDENAAQHERGNELASAKAQSSAQAVNDYQRNKDKLAYDQRSGLQDRTTGQFKQGLKDASSQGFSGNSAEAAKSAASSDKSAAASQSDSNLEAKEKSENEALRDRDYVRRIENNDSETFTRRKQFFHNKKEGGNNDESLKYDRKKLARKFGVADEAELAKENNFQQLHENGKISSQSRNFEDLVDRRNNLQHENRVNEGAEKGFENKDATDEAAAQASSSGFQKKLAKNNADDSESSAFNRRQSLQDESDAERQAAQDSKNHAKNVAVDLEYVRPTNGAPLGDIRAVDVIGADVLSTQTMDKGPKEHNVPDVIVDIQPIHPPPKVEQPKQPRPIPPLPDVQQVKSFQPPKHNKGEVNYDTGRASNLAAFSNQPRFSRINGLSIFKGPRRSSFNPKQQATPKSRFSLQRLGARRPSTAKFGSGLFGNSFARRGW